MKSLRTFSFLLALAVLVGSLGGLTYREIRQERLNRALIAAIRANDTSDTLSLLKQGADPNVRDELPQSLSLWQQLLDRWRNKHSTPSNASTALIIALTRRDVNGQPFAPIGCDHPQIIKALLDKGADINTTDQHGELALTLALQHPSPEVRRDLLLAMLNRGANINAQNWDGGTALMYAVFKLDVHTVQILLAHRANPNMKDKIGQTALSITKFMSKYYPKQTKTIHQLLKQAGAKE